jgi:hypothetical protein
MDSIQNKLQDLLDDIVGRDSVLFRMHLSELSVRGLYDAELDELTVATWSTLFDEDVWCRISERLKTMSARHAQASTARK